MNISGQQLFFRHSGSQAELNNYVFKTSPHSRQIFNNRRINTEVNQKTSAPKKYLIKRGTKIVQNLSKNASKQNCNRNQTLKFWDRVSFNEFEWGQQTKQQHAVPTLNKRPTHKQQSHFKKIQELDKLIRRKGTQKIDCIKKINRTQQNIKTSKQKENLKAVIQCTGNMLKDHKDNTSSPYEQIEQSETSKYEIVASKLLGAGTFGKVYAGVNKTTGQKVAIKKVHNDKNYKCREIELMELVRSPFVVSMLDKYVSFEPDQKQVKQFVNIVMPKFECSFFDYLKPRNYELNSRYTKVYLYQIFRGILHMHSRGICHRDLKPQNVLIKNNRLVICDLGSAKILRKDEPNISYICSRCYRAPELIFGATDYGVSVDIWSAGCIILQMMHKGPYFIAKDSLHHLIQIMKVMGTPKKKQILSMNPNYDVSSYDLPSIKKTPWSEIFPQFDSQLIDLVSKIMTYDPNIRLTAQQVLCHSYFDQIRDKHFLSSFGNEIDTHDFFTFDECEINFMQKPHRLQAK